MIPILKSILKQGRQPAQKGPGSILFLWLLFLTLAASAGLFADPFSFQAVSRLTTATCSDPLYYTGEDGVKIAYRSYLPANPRMVVILIHGGGAHSCAGYQYLARKLMQNGVAVHTPDLRGHGLSGYDRGDGESTEQLYGDLNAFLKQIPRPSNVPLILMGHSSGAGYLLNAASVNGAILPDGYLFLAPEFGHNSSTARETEEPFATADIPVFITNAMSGGALYAHSLAVEFHYPEAIRKQDPLLLTGITTTMALALTPDDPEKQLDGIPVPVRILTGRDDELIDPEKLTRFVANLNRLKSLQILEDTTHLSILLHSKEVLAELDAMLIRAR